MYTITREHGLDWQYTGEHHDGALFRQSLAYDHVRQEYKRDHGNAGGFAYGRYAKIAGSGAKRAEN